MIEVKKPKKPKKSSKSKKVVKTWVCPRCKHKQKRRGKNDHSVRCTQCGKFEFAKKYPDARLKKNQSEIQSRVRDEKLKQTKKPKKPKKQKKTKPIRLVDLEDSVTYADRDLIQVTDNIEQPESTEQP